MERQIEKSTFHQYVNSRTIFLKKFPLLNERNQVALSRFKISHITLIHLFCSTNTYGINILTKHVLSKYKWYEKCPTNISRTLKGSSSC